jgi:hypothetical protein
VLIRILVDPECDIAVATMAQLLLQQGKVTEALTYFERAAELSRTEGEIVNALSYAEATRTQLEVSLLGLNNERKLIRDRCKKNILSCETTYKT